MNKVELSKQIQENLLVYLDDMPPGLLYKVCDMVNKTINEHE
jgi:hypothetical protein